MAPMFVPKHFGMALEPQNAKHKFLRCYFLNSNYRNYPWTNAINIVLIEIL